MKKKHRQQYPNHPHNNKNHHPQGQPQQQQQHDHKYGYGTTSSCSLSSLSLSLSSSSSSSLMLLLLVQVLLLSSNTGGGVVVAAFRQPTTTTPSQQHTILLPSNGPIADDAQCNVEDLEVANDSQLYSILMELIETSFFRTFAVELDTKCPLTSGDDDDGDDDDDDNDNDKQKHNDGDDDDDAEDDFQCGSGSNYDDEFDDTYGDTMSFAGFGGGSSGVGMKMMNEFDSSEPLCSVKAEEVEPLDSNALNSLSSSGFSSKDQQETFDWKQQTDMIIQPNADLLMSEDCTGGGESKKLTDGLLPDTFWMDMCSNITQGNGTKTVNLPLNPERNTGYNGTHIWEAIYQESGGDRHRSEAPQNYEQRVLYRLISGLHTQTTLSIASNYYPPAPRKGRMHWQAHPTLFYDRFKDHPDYIRNLQFSYVVLLRALNKAAPFLANYEIRTGDIVQDHAATVLLQRLLDSNILQSCSSVFQAFDESSMFQQQQEQNDVKEIQQTFKAVFHNISSILDCVQCQQCKLHGKLVMLGYGTALKILFIKQSQNLILDRNEIVAFLNTIAKLSNSLREVRDLTQLYWEHQQQLSSQQEQEQQRQLQQQQQQQQQQSIKLETTATTKTTSQKLSANLQLENNWELVDVAVGLASSLGKKGHIPKQREAELVQLALKQDPKLLILAKHYHDDVHKFLEFSNYDGTDNKVQQQQTPSTQQKQQPDAIIIGSGLAGLSAALTILDRGGTVVLIEKEHLLGGNSNKASSGINACCPSDGNNSTSTMDTVEIFQNDTIRSAGKHVHLDLISVLTSKSAEAVTWLRERVGVDLSLKAQLGGHSSQRTHRPKNGMAGAEIIYAMVKAVRKYEKSGRIQILVDTTVTELLTNDDSSTNGTVAVIGVKYNTTTADGNKIQEQHSLFAPHVVLATGGFASDRSSGSYMEQYRPELMQFPTTAGSFSTGDGIALATALGANTINMDKVQIHPTGWIDPKDPNNPTKTLAAELMRGVGGILLNDEGKRFCNELGTRAYVTDRMLSHDPYYAKTKKWNNNNSTKIPTFYLVLSSAAVQGGGKKHVDLYTHKGLLTKLDGLTQLAEYMNLTTPTKKNKKNNSSSSSSKTKKTGMDVLEKTLLEYQNSAKKGKDEFGKTSFRGVPMATTIDTNSTTSTTTAATSFENETFYVGMVTPVLHYCMGGITIDVEGNVINEDGNIIPGLHAAGEVTGGVHGDNRLGGNSLLECTVFGKRVGQNIPIHTTSSSSQREQDEQDEQQQQQQQQQQQDEKKNKMITMNELQQHNQEDDCWVAIHGIVYDLTDFAQEHPAGPQSIYDLAGMDGTEAFAAIHNEQILIDDFQDDQIGRFVNT